MSARKRLYAALMVGQQHSPENSERASAAIDAFREEVIAEVAVNDARVIGNAAGDVRAAEAARGKAEAERDGLRARVDFWERCTLPDLERKVAHEKDAKLRWRARAEKAEARPTWAEAYTAAAELADDAASRLHHRNLPEQAAGAQVVALDLRDKAREAGERP